MKLHATQTAHLNTITGYGEDYVEVNAQARRSSLLLMPEAVFEDWPVVHFVDLTPEHFAAIAALKPEVALFGSGATLRFPHPRLTQPLVDAGIAIETMDMRAACRTYNILMAEGRRVALALLIEAP